MRATTSAVGGSSPEGPVVDLVGGALGLGMFWDIKKTRCPSTISTPAQPANVCILTRRPTELLEPGPYVGELKAQSSSIQVDQADFAQPDLAAKRNGVEG